MFEEFREYVAANLRRAQLRRENRHLLKTVRTASHPRLAAAALDLHWDCMGDLTLLDYPVLLPIVVSRRADELACQRTKIEAFAEIVKRVANRFSFPTMI